MTKSKSSTIAIVVLSVLLAAALASTIVLAAFNFSQKATTNITFGNGVAISVSGMTDGGSSAYYWNYNQGSTPGNVGTITVGGGEDITLSEIKATVTGADAYIAIKASISGGSGAATVNPAYNSSVIAADSILTGTTGWYIIGSDSAATIVKASDGEKTLINTTTLYDASEATSSQYEGKTYTCTVTIAAATDIAGLITLCKTLG